MATRGHGAASMGPGHAHNSRCGKKNFQWPQLIGGGSGDVSLPSLLLLGKRQTESPRPESPLEHSRHRVKIVTKVLTARPNRLSRPASSPLPSNRTLKTRVGRRPSRACNSGVRAVDSSGHLAEYLPCADGLTVEIQPSRARPWRRALPPDVLCRPQAITMCLGCKGPTIFAADNCVVGRLAHSKACEKGLCGAGGYRFSLQGLMSGAGAR